MNILKNIYIIIAVLLISSCSKDEVIVADETNFNENEASVSQNGFLPGDEVTRTTLSYGAEGLTINWNVDDKFGIFPTSGANGPTPTDISMQSFTCYSVDNNPQNASINSDNSGFQFLTTYGYTAYYAKTIKPETYYNNIDFDFTEQTQKGYVNMGAYYRASNDYNNPTYKESETAACQHLSDVDVLISPEMKRDDTKQRMFFPMRHIGAIARFFLLTPAKKLKIKELRLISNNKIFYETGKVTLTKHPYVEAYVPLEKPITVTAGFDYSTDKYNFGVCLPQFIDPQVTPNEASQTNCLVLKFGDNGNGIETLYSSDTTYGNYLLAYMMMYPINTTDADNVYVYVTAEDLETNKPLYFRSGKLANKNMFSGYVYQWKERTTEDTPIELTATLQTWQEVASGAIDTTLEK